MARFSKQCPGPKCSKQCRATCSSPLSVLELCVMSGVDAFVHGAVCASAAFGGAFLPLLFCASIALGLVVATSTANIQLEPFAVDAIAAADAVSAAAGPFATRTAAVTAAVTAAITGPFTAFTVASVASFSVPPRFTPRIDTCPLAVGGCVNMVISDLHRLRSGAGMGATALGLSNLNLIGNMPIAHGDGGTPVPTPSRAAEPLPLVPEVWPPEAETLTSEACDDTSVTLFGTLSRKLGLSRKSYFAAFAKAMLKRINSVGKRPPEPPAAASSTMPNAKKSRAEEEETPAASSTMPNAKKSRAEEEEKLTWASSNDEMAQMLSNTYGTFNEKTSENVFAGCTYAEGTADERASRVAMLDRLSADECVMPDPVSADTLKEWGTDTMKEQPEELECAIGDPGAGLRGTTSVGAVVMTYPRKKNRGLCSNAEEMLAAPSTEGFFQSAHATIERGGGTITVALTIAIGLAVDMMLCGDHPAWIVDGQFLHNLAAELKDAAGHLIPPTDFCRSNCYAQIFDRCFRAGRRAFVVVEGRVGRMELMTYIKRFPHSVAVWTQATLDALEINLSLLCDVLSTNAGAIFELNIFGYTSLIILRPSTGSYAFINSFNRRELMLLFRTLHNQMVVLGRLMRLDIPSFKDYGDDASPLATLFTTKGAAELTEDLHERGLIAPDVVYQTPSQIGGLESVAGAGLWSERLQRITMTMVERGQASVAGAGLWSERLQRITMTMVERGQLGAQLGGQASAAGAGLWSERLQRITMTMVERAQLTAQLGDEIQWQYRQQTQQQFQQLTPPQQQQQMQQMQEQQMQQQQQQQQMPIPHLPMTFTREEAQTLKQKEAEAMALYFTKELKIDVAPRHSKSTNRTARTLPMVRADLMSKWPEGLAAVTVQVSR